MAELQGGSGQRKWLLCFLFSHLTPFFELYFSHFVIGVCSSFTPPHSNLSTCLFLLNISLQTTQKFSKLLFYFAILNNFPHPLYKTARKRLCNFTPLIYEENTKLRYLIYFERRLTCPSRNSILSPNSSSLPSSLHAPLPPRYYFE